MLQYKSLIRMFSAAFAALATTARFFSFPIVPGLIVFDLAGAFTYLPASLISLTLSFVFVLVSTYFAPNPPAAAFAWVVSVPIDRSGFFPLRDQRKQE